VVEGHLLPPPDFRVALLAARSQLPFVRIVFPMAADASRCELIAIKDACVTGIAFCRCVAAPQGKARSLIVVKPNRRPLLWPMAGFTFLTVPASVFVLDIVAGHAARG
jgi:hypothetical protein